jgi:hypothetical protein
MEIHAETGTPVCGTGHRFHLAEGLAIGERDPQAVRAMFDGVARRYDLVNTQQESDAPRDGAPLLRRSFRLF